MRYLLIIIAASAAFFVPALVSAQSPSPTITVVAEPPGDNCEFGGVKVTVTPAEEPSPTPTSTPTPEPTDTPEPDPTEDPTEPPTAAAAQAEPEITYVCNGQPGDPGDNGQDGADGADGDNGLDGMDAEPETPGVQAAVGDRCATAGVKKLKLPKRFRSVKRVTVTANSQRRRALVKHRVIKVNLRRVPCGYYPVLVQRRRVRTWLIVLRLTPHRVVRTSVR